MNSIHTDRVSFQWSRLEAGAKEKSKQERKSALGVFSKGPMEFHRFCLVQIKVTGLSCIYVLYHIIFQMSHLENL